MTKLLPNVRMEKKVETVAFRCSYDLRQVLEAEAESFGITPSTLIENILTDHAVHEGKPCLSGKHPIEAGVRELHHLTLDICVDGVITPLERQRWTKKMSELFYRMWHEEQDKQEEIA